MRRIRLWAAISAGFALAVGAVAPLPAGASGPSPDARANPPADNSTTVRLITGDRVTVTPAGGGRQTASVTPGDGRRGVVFRTYEQDGHVTVLPSDAGALVSTGRLDRRLFDVTALIAQKYDTAHTDALPLIVESGGRATPSALQGLAAEGTSVRGLDSIGARAVRVDEADLGRFWKQLLPVGGQLKKADVAATPRVWLDQRIRASLDRSTAQIGAPAVWQTGSQGDGVKVAVLDTGADGNHPDLAGRIVEAKDFSGSSGTGDVYGHGTHVASIVGGSGAASGGSRKGVAPGARLLVGKVLGDDGYGSESSAIAGMEWAAAQGAKVVNMSLGSEGSSDGTDPMSQALNEISRSTGTLFVVAAGNAGEQGAGTVGSPGAADAALTVGAVDRKDALASFSSRGPRYGDDAVKPDVTAPGVDIVAARAAGTTMGTPVDADYVAASGTSMATPHVAGAAALLAQRHPDWDGARLKDALVSTAVTVPGQKVTEEGGGRIDVRAAALGPVTATGTLALGPFESDATTATDATASRIRYANSSDQDVTLALSVKLATDGGRAPAEGSVRLGAESVRVPAGATVEVPLTVDPSRAGRGKYYGYVTAASADGRTTVHTTLGLVVRGPTHRLTVKMYDKDGKPADGYPSIWGPDGFAGYTNPSSVETEVEEGVYQLENGWIDNSDDGQELRQVVLPEVKVTKDTTVTLDARTTVPVEIRTPRPAEQRGILSFQTHRELDGREMTQGTMYFDIAKRLYVSPTAKVTEGSFEFSSRWQLVAPMLRARVPGPDLDLNPFYMPRSPFFPDRGATLTAVDAGDASAPDFRHARGRLAVVDNPEGASEDELVERAAAAGVRAVVLVHPDPSGWTRWTPQGERLALPTIRIGAGPGARLLARMSKGSTPVTFSGAPRSPYMYDVMQVSSGQIPSRVVHTVSDRNSAVIKSTYADNGGTGQGWAAEQRFGWRPYFKTAWLQYTRLVPLGAARTEYVSSGDTTWQHLVHYRPTFDMDGTLGLGMRDRPRTYRPGTQPAETWAGAVVRPSIPAGTATPTVRDGNVLRLRIPEFTDSQAGHWAWASVEGDIGAGSTSREWAGDSVSAVLYRDGKKLGDLRDAWRDVEVGPERAAYRLDMATARDAEEWRTGTATTTSWSFASGRTDAAAPLPLPLLQLDYDVPVDARNTLRGAGTHTLGLRVRAQDGLPAPRGVTVRVETSFDDGRTWSAAKTTGLGPDSFRAKVDSRPAKGAWVTLRVTASDADGNAVRQTVRRAYALR
ncbi:S8 family serine peptidase [Streptomyces laurentii]|uniref:S8 family serine peptidase n=1 Tax=Streptomyces laurentii TaxID=39478 RepID=UPI0033CFEFBB